MAVYTEIGQYPYCFKRGKYYNATVSNDGIKVDYTKEFTPPKNTPPLQYFTEREFINRKKVKNADSSGN